MPTCDCNIIHEDEVEKAKARLVEETELYDLADFFKVLGDSTRMKIISILSEAELCVCDLAYVLDMKQSAVSHQLRVLKNARLVKWHREGKVVYYTLDDDHVETIFKIGLNHLKHG